MEFITVEQFKEQPKEVQEVFLDWWKPRIGDIFIFNTDEYDNSDSNIGVLGSIKQINITRRSKGKYRIPLFTEGQLRKFIEDKTGCRIETVIGIMGYCFVFRLKDSRWEKDRLSIVTDDLLQAYWKVACMVAKEGLNG